VIKRVFVDSDVILDVALARMPFLEHSKMLLSMLENGLAIGFVSANSIANIYYVLRKAGDDTKARFFISSILKYLTVIPSNHVNILDALKSDFSDFEDAIQYFSALENQCECIITRNVEDYKKSKLNVYLPLEFLNLFQ
jgi:predicted nucleic acid-binding protein